MFVIRYGRDWGSLKHMEVLRNSSTTSTSRDIVPSALKLARKCARVCESVRERARVCAALWPAPGTLPATSSSRATTTADAAVASVPVPLPAAPVAASQFHSITLTQAIGLFLWGKEQFPVAVCLIKC